MRTLLTYGDSNTHGTLPIRQEDVRERLGRADRWPGVCVQNLGVKWSLVEEGLPGRTTCRSDPEMGAHMDGRLGLFIALGRIGPPDLRCGAFPMRRIARRTVPCRSNRFGAIKRINFIRS